MHGLRGNYMEILANLKQLHAELWTDKYTRAVFFEMTVYNAQANLFVIITMVAEFIDAAGYWVSYRWEQQVVTACQEWLKSRTIVGRFHHTDFADIVRSPPDISGWTLLDC